MMFKNNDLVSYPSGSGRIVIDQPDSDDIVIVLDDQTNTYKRVSMSIIKSSELSCIPKEGRQYYIKRKELHNVKSSLVEFTYVGKGVACCKFTDPNGLPKIEEYAINLSEYEIKPKFATDDLGFFVNSTSNNSERELPR